ncbi:aerobic-type carbon monoxide dehydrogenase, middle subunit CoxM/CutM homologs [Longilinea arvoryzae]|uniref:Aerobic-type carbon monoxide dehydrogenase, middle subunit CoxM/CutM homologs n=1 Tax=Longilinea arvoryzae TaxID=360412 RepID=A0A0S7BJB8_9CHLR|nr:xanthine dehydrogenase family protein subunit M [Longilinea arvoryzae]GAP15721.1 aerobic-type carbon monoxide dehydrogenase, middle subunit CoxM/CutM homologs [Longilinea arvoryzae]
MVTITHPSLPAFEYIQPKTLAEASRFLSEHADEARPFLGGTDLFVRMRDGVLSPRFLVDVKNLDGTNELRFDPQTGLTIGAAVSMNRVIASPDVQGIYPLLAEACRSVAGYQLRTRATIVGNLCNASPAGDTLGACLALDGFLHIHGTAGPRREMLSDFFVGPGKTTLKPGDIVTAVGFPLPPRGCAGVYLKLGRNRLSDLSIVGVTVLGSPDPGLPSGAHFRIVLASVAPVPLVAVEAETYLLGQPITPETLHRAAHLASEATKPIDDIRSSARYRKLMVASLTEKALTAVWKKILQ